MSIFGTLDAHIRDYCWHLWFREVSWGIIHVGWLTDITAGCNKVPLHFLHCLGKKFQISQTKVKDVAFQVTAPTLEVGLGIGICTLGFFPSVLTFLIIGLGCLPLAFTS